MFIGYINVQLPGYTVGTYIRYARSQARIYYIHGGLGLQSPPELLCTYVPVISLYTYFMDLFNFKLLKKNFGYLLIYYK